jgi:hypothetical protein
MQKSDASPAEQVDFFLLNLDTRAHTSMNLRDGTVVIWGNNDFDQTGMRNPLFVPTILQLHFDGIQEGSPEEESTYC